MDATQDSRAIERGQAQMRHAILSSEKRSLCQAARFLLACIPLTDYHTLAYCCWHANLRWSAER